MENEEPASNANKLLDTTHSEAKVRFLHNETKVSEMASTWRATQESRQIEKKLDLPSKLTDAQELVIQAHLKSMRKPRDKVDWVPPRIKNTLDRDQIKVINAEFSGGFFSKYNEGKLRENVRIDTDNQGLVDEEYAEFMRHCNGNIEEFVKTTPFDR